MKLSVFLNTTFTSAFPVLAAWLLAWLFKTGPEELPLWVLALASLPALYAIKASIRAWPPKQWEDTFLLPELIRGGGVAIYSAHLLGSYHEVTQPQVQLEYHLLLLLVLLTTALAIYAKSRCQ